MGKRHSTNIYRQLDPSALNVLVETPDSTIYLVTTDPDDDTQVILYFTQAIVKNRLLLPDPDWNVDGNPFVSWGDLAADGKSLKVKFDATLSSGTTYSFPVPGRIQYDSVLGGTIIGGTGTVEDPSAAPGTFNVDYVLITAPNEIYIHFDANPALLGNGIGAQPYADFSNCSFGSATVTDLLQLGTAYCRVATSGTVTSGSAFSIGPAPFISVTAQSLNPATGVIGT